MLEFSTNDYLTITNDDILEGYESLNHDQW